MSDANDWQRQFQAWGQGWLNAFSPSAAAATPPWGQMPWGQPPTWPGGAAAPAAGEAANRFGQQFNDYLALMRGIAEQAAQGATADTLAQAWREALAGVAGGNPMLAALSSISGEGARGIHELASAAQAALAPMQSQLQALFGVPAVGMLREHQQRLQALARDQAALQQAAQRYAALLQEASERAFAVFEGKLGDRTASGQPLETGRQLYDLWIDAAEESYAQLALSPRFGEAFGALVNAQMKVRQGVQQQVEHGCAELGMPTRREVDAAHRRIVDLQRRLAELESRTGAAPPDRSGRASASGAAPTPKKKPARKAAAKPAAKPKAATRRASASAATAPTAPRAPAGGGRHRKTR